MHFLNSTNTIGKVFLLVLSLKHYIFSYSKKSRGSQKSNNHIVKNGLLAITSLEQPLGVLLRPSPTHLTLTYYFALIITFKSIRFLFGKS
jgi:hypothetical protein